MLCISCTWCNPSYKLLAFGLHHLHISIFLVLLHYIGLSYAINDDDDDKLIACRQTSTAKEPLTEAHVDFRASALSSPSNGGFCFFNTPDPKTVQANRCAVDPNQIHFNLLSLLQLLQQRPKKTVFAHTFESCINRMPVPKTGRSTSPPNPVS